MTTLEQEADLDFEFNAQTIGCIFIAFVVGALANSAGVGGGFFWTPLFNSLLGFSVNSSAALSQACTAAGALGSCMYNVPSRHPEHPNEPLMSFSLALVIAPMLMLGLSMGVLINPVLPSLVVACMLFVALCIIALRSFYNAMRMRSREVYRSKSSHEMDRWAEEGGSTGPKDINSSSNTLKKVPTAVATAAATADDGDRIVTAAAAAEGDDDLDSAMSHHSATGAPSAVGGTLGSNNSSNQLTDLEVEKDNNTFRYPWTPIALMVGLWAIFFVFQLSKSWQHRCDLQFWLLYGFQIALTIAFNVFTVWQQLHPDKSSYCVGTAKLKEWSTLRIILMLSFTLVAGVFIGIVGLGGGVFIAPFLIELGVHPLASAATSTLIVLATSSTGAISFALDDKLNLEYAAVYGAVCLLGALAGLVVVSKIVRKYHMGSLVVYIITLIITGGAVLTVAFGIREGAEEIADGGDFGVEDFCTT